MGVRLTLNEIKRSLKRTSSNIKEALEVHTEDVISKVETYGLSPDQVKEIKEVFDDLQYDISKELEDIE